MPQVEGRKSSRFAVQLPLSFTESRRAEPATILNISREGCLVTSNRSPEPPAYVTLDMQLQEGQDSVYIELAAVRWASGSRFGVEFIKIGPEQRLKLGSFIALLEKDILP